VIAPLLQSEGFRKLYAHNLEICQRVQTLARQIEQGVLGEVRKRHESRGKLWVRDRVGQLIDPGSRFLELSLFAGHECYDFWAPSAGLITGIGSIVNRPVMIIANDATVKGGAYLPLTLKKHLRAQQIASENRLACVYLVDSGGAYLPLQHEIFADRDHFGRIFFNQSRMSQQGLAQVAAVMGSCTAGGAYVPAMADETVIVDKTGSIFLAGPPLVKSAIHETSTAEELGGASLHAKQSGLVDYRVQSDQEALSLVRSILSQTDCGQFYPPKFPVQPALLQPMDILGLIPSEPVAKWDVRKLCGFFVDNSELREFKPEYGESMFCAWGAIWGHSVGLVVSNGILFGTGAQKAAHFVDLCDKRGVAIVFLQNITGFMVGKHAESSGIAKQGAQLVGAVASARVPKLTVIMGASFGAGNYALCGRAFDPRFLWVWPMAQTAVMGLRQMTEVLTQIKGSEVKKSEVGADESVYTSLYSSSHLWDDGIIMPWETRDVLGQALSFCFRVGLASGDSLSRVVRF
jgi:3-methylcrotonyl-CoA carboxylase beta subunit